MANTKPWVSLACLCEKAIQEKDNVISLIRVIDTLFIGIPQNFPSTPTVQFACVISLKSGDLVGSFDKLKIIMTTPSGDVKPLTETAISTAFTGGANGANVQINVTMEVKRFGLGWFDVMWGDEVLTRIPVEVKPLDQMPKQA